MSEIDETEDKVQPDEPELTPAAAPKPKPSGGGVAWIALLVAVIALAAVGYTIYEDWRTQQDLELSSGNIEDSISKLSGRIESSKDALAANDADWDSHVAEIITEAPKTGFWS